MFNTALIRRPSLRPRNISQDPFFTFVDRFFNDGPLSDFTAQEGENGQERSWIPPVDIVETDSAFVATVDLPGLTKDDVDLSLEENVLTLSGQRTKEAVEEGKLRRVERVFGSFSRSFTVPRGVDPSKVTAKFENGVLALTLPKSEVAQLRKIEIA